MCLRALVRLCDVSAMENLFAETALTFETVTRCVPAVLAVLTLAFCESYGVSALLC